MQYPPKLQSSLSLDLKQRIAYVLKSPPMFWCDITLQTVAKEESNIKMDILLHQFRKSLSAVHYNETVDEVALSTEMEDPNVKEVFWPGIDVDAALPSFSQIIQPTQSFSFISWDTVPAPVFKVLGVIFLQVYMDRDIARAIRNLTAAVLHRLQLPLTLLGLLWLAYMFECKALTESLIALCELYYMYLILCKTIRERQLKNACIILTSIVFMLVKMWSFSDFLSR
ncbi:hypothetical protein HOLleu_24182 [Holothuria leucospilota]|uniref:Uncharacterized protein n=1 Tax=Holothuria leucospilota TaxID=206669 RepID=A0A9Q1BW26_HOLLE|nr:hypothetical protein HOLleu_24182 [Holothuria leucospilota]